MAIYDAPESLHVGTGTETVFGFNWPYLLPRDLRVTVNGIAVAPVLASPNQVAIVPAPAALSIVRIFRNTPAQNPTYLFATGIPMLPKYIDGNNKQLLYALQEGLLQFAQTQSTANAALEAARQAQLAADRAAASAAQQAANIRRTVRIPGTDPEIPELPVAAGRANRYLAFNGVGDPVVVPIDSGSGTQLAVDLATPSLGKGGYMSAWKRNRLTQAITTVGSMLDAQSVQAYEFANLITDKPDPADPSTWDWYPAIAAAVNYATTLKDGATVALPRHWVRMSAGLVVPHPIVSLEGNMCVMDFTSMISGTALTFVRSASNRPSVQYGGNQAVMSRFAIVGPGRDKSVQGLRLGSVPGLPSATGQAPVFNCVYVQGFADAIYAGNDAYLAKFRDCEFYSNACVLNLPGGLVNYGENFSFVGGSAHGNRRVLTLEANSASVFFDNFSFDFNGKEASTAFYIRNSIVNCTDCHWEMGHLNTPVTVPPLDISGDQARFTFTGGFLLAHAGAATFSPEYFALIGAGSSVSITGGRVFGIQPTKAFALGAGRLHVGDWELGNTSTVTGWGKDQVLMDYGFEATAPQDMVYINQGIGTALDWRTGENVILSNSTVDKFSGNSSLRVQKRIGASSTPTGSTSFVIAIPSMAGDRYHYRFKCRNKDARAGAVGVTMHWGRLLGSDKDGIPRSAQGAAFSIYSFTPTAAWGTHFPLNNINGADAAACPQNADTLFIRVNLNEWVGGTDAPEGGWYSLYFDEFELYRW